MQLIISEGKVQHEMKIEKGRLICLLLIPLASLACKKCLFFGLFWKWSTASKNALWIKLHKRGSLEILHQSP